MPLYARRWREHTVRHVRAESACVIVNVTVLERLQSGGSDRFVDLLLDDVLDRPVSEIIDPEWFARQLVSAARSAAADPRVERALHERLSDARKRVPTGPVRIPAEISDPLRKVLTRPYTPDRALVGRLLDHAAVRDLLRHLFQDLLVAFAKKLRPPIPSTGLSSAFSGKGPLGGFGKLGGGMLGAVGEEVERQIEHKAREFMDHAVDKLVGKMADQLCSAERGADGADSGRADYGAFRTHVVDVLSATDAKVLAGEFEKLDPDALVDTATAVLRAYVARDATEGEIASLIRTAVTEAGSRTSRELLGGTEEHALGMVRDFLRQRALAVVATPGFAAWWDEMNGVEPA